jgi:2-polyprenyl-3-methyl-5-hydroxy-6-metoxy-1,4-benzoquinol methylase
MSSPLERELGAAAPSSTHITCRVCGGRAIPRMVSMDFNRKLAESEFTYYQCTDCSSLALAAPPADLDRFYPADYYRLPGSRHELAAIAEHERYKLEIIQRFATSGRLVEIGPAVGGFAYLASQAGFSVETVEMDERCCHFLRDVVGVAATQTADARAVLEHSSSLQVIALWHVVEHLTDPMETLEAAARALGPGGILVVAAPNPAAMQFALFRARWAHLDAPRHLQLIPARYIQKRSIEWGLQTALVTATDRGGLGWNAFGWQVSLNNVASTFGLTVPKLAAKVIGRLARPVERKGLRGAAYTLVLRKDG